MARMTMDGKEEQIEKTPRHEKAGRNEGNPPSNEHDLWSSYITIDDTDMEERRTERDTLRLTAWVSSVQSCGYWCVIRPTVGRWFRISRSSTYRCLTGTATWGLLHFIALRHKGRASGFPSSPSSFHFAVSPIANQRKTSSMFTDSVSDSSSTSPQPLPYHQNPEENEDHNEDRILWTQAPLTERALLTCQLPLDLPTSRKHLRHSVLKFLQTHA